MTITMKAQKDLSWICFMKFLNDMSIGINDDWKIVKFWDCLDFNFTSPSWWLSQKVYVSININGTILREKLFIKLYKIKCILPYNFVIVFITVKMIAHSPKETIPVSSNLNNLKIVIFKRLLKFEISFQNFLLMLHLIISELLCWFLRLAKRIFRTECLGKFTNWNDSFWWQLYPFIINIFEPSVMYMDGVFIPPNDSCF